MHPLVVLAMQAGLLMVPQLCRHFDVRKRRQSVSTPRVLHSEASSAPRTPTHFVALPLGETAVQERMLAVQQKLTEHDERLSAACLPLETAHITLSVVNAGCGNSQRGQVELATNAVRCALLACQSTDGVPQPKISHISSFGSNVLFFGLEQDDEYQKLVRLANRTRAELVDAGFKEPIEKPFFPHITIAKLSRLKASTKRKRKCSRFQPIKQLPIDGSIGKLDEAIPLRPRRVDICKLAPRNADGWYQTEHSSYL